MWRWLVPGVVILVILAVAGVVRHRRRRNRLYAQLADARQPIVVAHPIAIAASNPQQWTDQFERERLVRVPNFVTGECLAALKREAVANLSRVERTFIPTHKKGGAVSYESISRHAPHCLSFYHSPEVQQWISAITGVQVYPTRDQDQSSLSLLCYTEAGDHINWHFDHNFYRGRHFTVLLSLANEAPDGGVSQSRLERKLADGTVCTCDTSPNSLVVFEGNKVLHRATPTGPGDLRIMLSMTYCSDPRINWFKEFIRRIKDTAFFGLRALWD
jgi:hypothetical protein